MPRRMQDKNRQNGGRTGQRTVFINGLEKSISYFRQAVFYGHSKSVKDNRGYNDKLQYLIDGLKISNSKSIEVKEENQIGLREAMASIYTNLKEEPSTRGDLLKLQAKLADWYDFSLESERVKKLIKNLIEEQVVLKKPGTLSLVRWNHNIFDGLSTNELNDLMDAMNFSLYSQNFSAIAYQIKKKIQIQKGTLGGESSDRFFSYRAVSYHSVLEEQFVRTISEAIKKKCKINIRYHSKKIILNEKLIPINLVHDSLYSRTHVFVCNNDNQNMKYKMIRMDRILAVNISNESIVDSIFEDKTFIKVKENLMDAWALSINSYKMKVQLRVSPKIIYQFTSQNRIKSSEIEKRGEWYEYTAYVNDWLEMKNWVLGFGSNVEVIAPKEFRDSVLESYRLLAEIQGRDFFDKHKKLKTGAKFDEEYPDSAYEQHKEGNELSNSLCSVTSNSIYMKECIILNYLLKNGNSFDSKEFKKCENFFMGQVFQKKKSIKDEIYDIWLSLTNDSCDKTDHDTEECEILFQKNEDTYFINEEIIESINCKIREVQPLFRRTEVDYLISEIKYGLLNLFLAEKTLDKLLKNIQKYTNNNMEECFDIRDTLLIKGEDIYRDTYQDGEFVEKFRLVKSALEQGECIEYEDTVWSDSSLFMTDGRGIPEGTYSFRMLPFNFEYSGLEKRIRINGDVMIFKEGEFIGCTQMQPYLSNIKGLKIVSGDNFTDIWEEKNLENSDSNFVYEEWSRKEKSMKLMIRDSNNSLERLLPRLEGYRLKLEPCDSTGEEEQLYSVEVFYPKQEERKIIYRVLGVCNYIVAVENKKQKEIFQDTAEAVISHYEYKI